MDRWTLGLGGSDHDFSAALMCGGDIRVAVEQERLTRIRYGQSLWFRDPVASAADYCLAAEGVPFDAVEEVVGTDTLPARVRAGWRGRQVTLFPHHLAHAASAYLMLPEGTRAGIIVYDGYGSIRPDRLDHDRAYRETVSLYRAEGHSIERLGGAFGASLVEHDDFPTLVTNSVGMFYELVTELLGYGPMDAGKTMGLASHGVPRHVEAFERFVEYGADREDCFRCATDDPALVEAIETALRDGAGLSARADVAASAQLVVERALGHFAAFFEKEDVDVIAVSGGCGLNSRANGRAAALLGGSRSLLIPPHAGDAGLAFGALWLARCARDGSTRLGFRSGSSAIQLSRPGRRYRPDECLAAVSVAYPRLARDSSVADASDLAEEVAGGAIVGLFNGPSEFGPRALGGRSLIADPRRVGVRERINREIKHREPFRPLAPMVLRSRYDSYFGASPMGDPFMLTVVEATARCRREAPAAVHVDGTARVQVVDDERGDPLLVELLNSFERLSGVGLLLNTSFNRRGEPIVESPADAVDAFLGMGLDGLYLDGEFYRLA